MAASPSASANDSIVLLHAVACFPSAHQSQIDAKRKQNTKKFGRLQLRIVDGLVNEVYTQNMPDKMEDPAMVKVRELFEESGMSLHALGKAMGYEDATARQSAFQFMKSSDPRISMLRRFAKAAKVSLNDLLSEHKKK
jgi:hypothetical protein